MKHAKAYCRYVVQNILKAAFLAFAGIGIAIIYVGLAVHDTARYLQRKLNV